jgi:AcrR family transcriptional regulator
MADTEEKSGARRERRRNVDRSASTRAQILDATIRALTQFGFGAVTNNLVAELAGVSRGAMMHHFPTRIDLLVATVEYAYSNLTAYRVAQLEKVKPGMPRFRAIIDLAFDTARMPEGLAVSEVRTGCRSDPELGEAVTPLMTHISADYGKFLGRNVREAGLEPTLDMRGMTATATMAARALAIDSFSHPNPVLIDNMLYALKVQRERIIADQLGPEHAMTAEQIEADCQKAHKRRKW